MSVDEFKVFMDNQGNLDNYTDAFGAGSFGNDDATSAAKVFDMDDNCDNGATGCTVFMRSQGLSSGSGVSDILSGFRTRPSATSPTATTAPAPAVSTSTFGAPWVTPPATRSTTVLTRTGTRTPASKSGGPGFRQS